MDIDISDVDGKLSLSDDVVTDYVAANYWPQDIFGKEELSEWAKDNGFVEEEEKE